MENMGGKTINTQRSRISKEKNRTLFSPPTINTIKGKANLRYDVSASLNSIPPPTLATPSVAPASWKPMNSSLTGGLVNGYNLLKSQYHNNTARVRLKTTLIFISSNDALSTLSSDIIKARVSMDTFNHYHSRWQNTVSNLNAPNYGNGFINCDTGCYPG